MNSSPVSELRAIVPVAGVGTRLRPHTHSTPKALIHVAGRPILAHILDDLRDLGVRDVALVIGHMGDAIRSFVDERYGRGPMRLHYVEQPVARGLGHAIHLAADAVRGHPVFILLGDTIVRADLASVLARGGNAIGVKEVEDPRRFGVVEVEDGRVRRLVEKPEVPPSNLAITGVYYFENADPLFDCLDELVRREVRTRGEFQLTDALQMMLERGLDLRTFPIQGWYDCGKTETLLETNRELLEMQGACAEVPGSVVVGPVAIDPSAVVEGCILGPHVSVAAGARLRGSVVRDAIVNPGATVENVLLESSVIGERARVEGAFQQLNVGHSSEVRIS